VLYYFHSYFNYLRDEKARKSIREKRLIAEQSPWKIEEKETLRFSNWDIGLGIARKK